MASIHQIADGLADAVVAQDRNGQLMPGEEFELLAAVIVFAERPLHLAVVAPAAEFQPLIAPLARLLGKLLQRQIGPGAGEQSDRPCHAAGSSQSERILEAASLLCKERR